MTVEPCQRVSRCYTPPKLIPVKKPFSSNGTLTLALNKEMYYSGETVRGLAILVLEQRIEKNQLWIKWKGYERTKQSWKQRSRRETFSDSYTQRSTSENLLFRESSLLHEFSSALEPGRYELPFSFKLPDNLPAVFYYRNNLNNCLAAVMYKVKVFIPGRSVSKSMKISVQSKQSQTQKPIDQEVSHSFFLTKGKLRSTVQLEKDIWTTNEEILVRLKVNNATGRRVHGIHVKLIQEIIVISGEKVLTEKNTVLSERFLGVDPFRDYETQLKLRLDPTLRPTTSGRFISCRYAIEVNCLVKMGKVKNRVAIHLISKPTPSQKGLLVYHGYTAGCWHEI